MEKKLKVWFDKCKKPIVILGSIVIIALVVFLIKETLANPYSGYLKNQTII